MNAKTLNTPLDSLKTMAVLITELVEHATDAIGGSQGYGCNGHEHELEMLDSIRGHIWTAVAEHVPGTQLHEWGAPSRYLNAYDDGTPIVEDVELRKGSYVRYIPRVHGDRDTYLALFDGLPTLRLAEDSPNDAHQHVEGVTEPTC